MPTDFIQKIITCVKQGLKTVGNIGRIEIAAKSTMACIEFIVVTGVLLGLIGHTPTKIELGEPAIIQQITAVYLPLFYRITHIPAAF